ncbi:hypothetical protein [Nocardia abscessus]|uniref:hypothetical protein n=1 Tax=Nocardia abscessus TaxID=120957 RepID=UPI00245752E8|nr:hypothetical protein [Nocardia abscessus]
MSHVLPPILPGGSPPVAAAPALTTYRNDRPLTTLYRPPSRHEPQWLCSVRRVDAKGRVIEKTLLPALGWRPGVRLGYKFEGKVVIVGSFGGPELWITATGDLRLPAPFRRKAGLHTADRILLAANLAEGVLLMFGPGAVDVMITRERQTTPRSGGGR